jgi:hypothetical protein
MEAYFFQVFLPLPDSAESPTARGFGGDCLFHTTIVLLGELFPQQPRRRRWAEWLRQVECDRRCSMGNGRKLGQPTARRFNYRCHFQWVELQETRGGCIGRIIVR